MSNEEGAGPTAPSLIDLEQRVRAFWKSTGVPARSLHGRADGPIFRFTEGPPTANGAPHVGHLLARTLKDVHLRYRRMRGYRIVSPMAGWDCHGLPVELEIEKRHGIRSKKEIERFGVARFCEECRASTLEVASVWESMSDRMGYWLDYAHPYLTMSAPYIESVWWSLKTLFDRGLLEKGYYVLPYCPRCETPLSSHEVAQGYRETTDPSVTVRFRLSETGGFPRSLLVWTTTPWTLPSNLLIAARPELAYVGVRGPSGGEEILAESALSRYYPDGAEVLHRYTGRDLAGRTYEPLFPFAGAGPGRYRVVLDEMVDASDGTGFVHIAPSYGPEDQRIGEREGVGHFDPLDSRAVFTEAVPPVHGKHFKSADPILLADLESRGALERAGHVKHTYPFCWRCSNALLYRAVDSWFVRTRKIADALVRHNATVTWVPAHLREGRFGNFLGEAKDWALSRNRYWGTPLPIWVCEAGHPTCVGSFAELAAASGAALPTPFDPHRMGVDSISFPCATCGALAHREPYTIDGWYDSGSAPFAQYHYPFEPGPFDVGAPLDFVAEGLDQTRGWFYTMLVIATALFDRPAYRVCISNGLVLDDAGLKMSKSKGNAVEPIALLERLGADATRWGFLLLDYTEPIRMNEAAMLQAANRTLSTLVHATAFYHQNAEADGLPGASVEPAPTDPLDRWLLSRLEGTREAVTQSLEQYDPRDGAIALRAFVDDLSTWYLRRSRPRFWSDRNASDRRSANDALSYALLQVAHLIAPFAPFTAEHLVQEVGGGRYQVAERSVHLADWPSHPGRRDEPLERAMEGVRHDVEIGRELRQRVGVKSRIPLERFILVGPSAPPPLGNEADRLLAEELNVTSVLRVDPGTLHEYPESDYERRSDGAGQVLALISRRPTPELRREGRVRETLRRLQSLRKDASLSFLEHVRAEVASDGDLFEAIQGARGRIAEELLADALFLSKGAPEDPARFRMWEIEGERLYARLERTGGSVPSGSNRRPDPVTRSEA
ncbi:MAG: isoleucine--tRNA ligase [Thermoplasmata archaeon]|nr:isoleucine--tRNA ligase [Thermoplasmata archaeon]MCI4359675.1 isoleucine--tRNA ligase [Thermoplasmata archaeon]